MNIAGWNSAERGRGEVEVGRKKEDDGEGGGGREGEVERKEE